MINKQPFLSVLSILTRLSKLGSSQKYYGQHSTSQQSEADFPKSSMSGHNGVTFSVLIENTIQFWLKITLWFENKIFNLT